MVEGAVISANMYNLQGINMNSEFVLHPQLANDCFVILNSVPNAASDKPRTPQYTEIQPLKKNQ